MLAEVLEIKGSKENFVSLGFLSRFKRTGKSVLSRQCNGAGLLAGAVVFAEFGKGGARGLLFSPSSSSSEEEDDGVSFTLWSYGGVRTYFYFLRFRTTMYLSLKRVLINWHYLLRNYTVIKLTMKL